MVVLVKGKKLFSVCQGICVPCMDPLNDNHKKESLTASATSHAIWLSQHSMWVNQRPCRTVPLAYKGKQKRQCRRVNALQVQAV